MSQLVFLLDKNVFYSALNCNELSRDLIEFIHTQCHKIILSPALSEAYWKILSGRENRSKSHYPNLARVLNEMILDVRKCDWAEENPVPGEEMMHKDEDRFMPRIAYGKSIIIVSNSRDDRRRLKAWAKLHSNSSTILSPKNARRRALRSC